MCDFYMSQLLYLSAPAPDMTTGFDPSHGLTNLCNRYQWAYYVVDVHDGG